MDYGVFHMSDDLTLRTYADMVYQVALRYTQNTADAEDVFSDVFLTYYTKKPEFACEEHRKAWLIRVTINLSHNLHRAQKGTAELTDELPTAEHGFEQVELAADLSEALRQMRPQYREVIVLFYLQELSIREIARVVDRNETTVRTQLFRGREQLRKFFPQETM